MENLQNSSLDEFNMKKLRTLRGLMRGLNYNHFSSIEHEILLMLVENVRTIPEEEMENYQIKEGTESWSIFNRLTDAYSTRTVEEEMEKLLIEYEHYELLALLHKLIGNNPQ